MANPAFCPWTDDFDGDDEIPPFRPSLFAHYVAWAAGEAIERDRIDMLRYLASRPIAGRSLGRISIKELVKVAVRCGNLDAIIYLDDRMASSPSSQSYPCSCELWLGGDGDGVQPSPSPSGCAIMDARAT